jgi:hypothetical protein
MVIDGVLRKVCRCVALAALIAATVVWARTWRHEAARPVGAGPAGVVLRERAFDAGRGPSRLADAAGGSHLGDTGR